MGETNFDAFVFFQEQISHQKIENRLECAKNLKCVIKVTGIERFTELIMCIRTLNDPEDEIMLALSKQLDQVINEMPCTNEHLLLVLELLEQYLGVDETVVRDSAINATISVIQKLNYIPDEVLEMTKRLHAKDWFPSRVSVCGVFPIVYKLLQNTEIKNEVSTLFGKLCKDEAPMVRRSAAKRISEFIEVTETETSLNYFLEILKTLFNDDQVTVKLLAIESYAKAATVLRNKFSESEIRTHIIPIVQQGSEDFSWRVRLATAQQFLTFCEAAGEQIINTEFITVLINFLHDGETQVRMVSIKTIPRLCQLFTHENFVGQIIPILQVLSEDIMLNVRSAVASACIESAALVNEGIAEQFIPILKQSLEDDPSISEIGYTWEHASIKLAILKNLSNVPSILPQLSTDLAQLFDRLARDEKWRVRKVVVETLPLLSQEYLDERLIEHYLTFFDDKVNEVRMAAVQIIPKLSQQNGLTWLKDIVFPKITQLFRNSKSYLHRITSIQSLKVLASDPVAQDIIPDIYSLIFVAIEDSIPNVRLVAAQVLGELVELGVNEELKTQIREKLGTLLNDTDIDVQKSSQIAFDSCT